jgi:hypothetical protein
VIKPTWLDAGDDDGAAIDDGTDRGCMFCTGVATPPPAAAATDVVIVAVVVAAAAAAAVAVIAVICSDFEGGTNTIRGT